MSTSPMPNDSHSTDSVLTIEMEAKSFGRPISRQRAIEIAAELEIYDASIDRLCAPRILNCDPGDFMLALVELGRSRHS